MKKKTIANLVMAAIIVVIAAAGVLTAGHIRGWFDKPDETRAVLTQVRGIVNLQRDGVLFSVEDDTVLRSGDRLTLESGASAVIQLGGDYLALGSKAEVVISDPDAGGFSVELRSGEVFANTAITMTLRFVDTEIALTDCAASLSVRTGAQSVYVYDGLVESGGKTASAGQQLSFVGDTLSVGSLSVTALNDFLIDQVRKANETRTLCFTAEDLDRLAADRQQALQDLLNSQTRPTDPPETEPEKTEPSGTAPVETYPGTVPPETAPSDPKPTDPKPTDPKPTDPKPTDPPATKPAETDPPATEPPDTKPAPVPAGSCVITIRCDTILDNMSELDPAKAEFVPTNGVILPAVTVQFYEGETVFDVLKRVCETAKIQLEYSWSVYGSYYIEGIHNLYEFDCGSESGWMYKVNGWFPNYGCSSCEVSDGDVIEWLYTCHGYGTDVGAPEWEG